MKRERECRALGHAGLDPGFARAAIEKHDRTMIARVGWATHAIVDTHPGTAHTHGLAAGYGHPDLQVVLPAAPETLAHLVNPIARAVTLGRRFGVGEEAAGVFNVPVRFMAAREGGRIVLRALLPDPRGRFPDDPGCEAGYRMQMDEPEARGTN